MQDSLNKLLRKNVEVTAHGGVVYKGQFIEASEDTLFLKSSTGWVTIPLDRVISVREEGVPRDGEGIDRDVDPSFFR